SSTVPVRGAGSEPVGGWLGRHASREVRVGTADGRSADDVATWAGEEVGGRDSLGTSPTVRRGARRHAGSPAPAANMRLPPVPATGRATTTCSAGVGRVGGSVG